MIAPSILLGEEVATKKAPLSTAGPVGHPTWQFRHHPPGGARSKREPQIILKTDERSIHLELEPRGKIRRQIKRLE